MKPRPRLPMIMLLAALLAGCSVFRLPTVQGNVIEQKQVDQLEIGMTPEQVRFLLGSPLVQDSFAPDHWEYVYYYRSPKGKSEQRVLSLYFESGRLNRITGQQPEGGKDSGASASEKLGEAQKTVDTQAPADSGAEEPSPITPP